MKDLVYIASPYTKGDIIENVNIQMDTWHFLYEWGVFPVAPLLTHYLNEYRELPYEKWIEYDLEILSRCKYLIRLPGESSGADNEVIEANKQNILCFESLKSFLIFDIIKTLSKKFRGCKLFNVYNKDTNVLVCGDPDTMLYKNLKKLDLILTNEIDNIPNENDLLIISRSVNADIEKIVNKSSSTFLKNHVSVFYC